MRPPSPDSLPRDIELVDAPEVGSLALLQATLTVARNSLCAHVTDIHYPEDALLPTNLPQPQALLVGLIIERIDELTGMLAGYRNLVILEHTRHLPYVSQDDEPF